jgi:hypothetical protein
MTEVAVSKNEQRDQQQEPNDIQIRKAEPKPNRSTFFKKMRIGTFRIRNYLDCD